MLALGVQARDVSRKPLWHRGYLGTQVRFTYRRKYPDSCNSCNRDGPGPEQMRTAPYISKTAGQTATGMIRRNFQEKI